MTKYETITNLISNGHTVTFTTAYKTTVLDSSNVQLLTTNKKDELLIKGVDYTRTTIKYY